MNVRQLKTIAILSVLSSVTAALFWLAKDEGEGKRSDFLGLVRHIDELNAKVDAEVFSIRYGVVHDLDRLATLQKQLHETITQWNLQSASLHCLEPWQSKNELATLLEQKQGRLDDFKSMQSVMRNSVASFLRISKTLQNEEVKESLESVKRVADVKSRGLEFVLTGNAECQSRFEASLTQLLEHSNYQSDSFQHSVELLQRHSQIMMTRGIELEKTIRETFLCSPESLLNLQLNAVSAWADKEQLRSTRFRFALFSSTLLLIAYCGFKMSQVQKIMRELAESNRMLDHRVASRTRDLQAKTDEAEQLALVAKYTDNSVIITDNHGRIEWTNEGFTRISGYTLEEVAGKRPDQFLLGPESCQKTVRFMREANNRRAGFDVEIVKYSKNGAPYWLAIESRPIIDRDGNVVKFIRIESDITARKHVQAERDQMQAELVKTSRQAGMAEVATGVLHNVGNVLNSVNVSANIAVERLKSSRVGTLAKASLVISEQSNLANFFSFDPRGESFPRLLQELASSLNSERDAQLKELHTLVENIDHIKEIVSMQQAFAKVRGNTEYVDLVQLIEDALKIDDAAFLRHKVKVERVFCDPPTILTEKHDVIQILLNLIKNAKQSVNSSGRDDKTLTLTITADETNVSIQVRDNGQGIDPEILGKIFNHGFTTKLEGHGFGLHSCALAAQKLGGSLSAHSDGVGQGATFILRLPLEKDSLCKV